MTDILFWLISVGFGLAIAAVIVVWLSKSRMKSDCEHKLASSISEKAVLQSKLDDLKAQLANLNRQVHQYQERNNDLNAARAALEAQALEKTRQIEKLEIDKTQKEDQLAGIQNLMAQKNADMAEIKTVLDEERKQAAEKIALLRDARDQLKTEFQNLAQKIFEEKSKKFTDQNRTDMDQLIRPLQEQISDFKKRVEDVYDKESRDRTALQTEILHLKDLNQQISKETLNLTKALKGDSKTQGNWGEVILERVLEASGLQKGREYDTQVCLQDQHGKRFRPDVVVRLPEGKDVIVDAKVSLNAYDTYYSAEDQGNKERALKAHIDSMRTHIRSLAAKGYEDLQGVRTLDYTLMFIPIEAAFLAAIDKDRDLFNEAFSRNIIIVSPSTLLVTLRTIQNIWRYEYQNRNALEIAQKAGGLYDKFVGFVDALKKVGYQLDKAKDAYRTAYDRLARGKGNLIRRSQDLKKLGVQTGKELPQNLLEMNDDEDVESMECDARN